MDIAEVMDDAARALRSIKSLSGRVYPYPVDTIDPPAGVVPFPTVDYDQAKGRGLDQLDIDVVVLVSKAFDRPSRDAAARYLAGGGEDSVRAAFEAHEWTACDLGHVSRGAVQPYAVADISFWAVVFPTRFFGSGTTS